VKGARKYNFLYRTTAIVWLAVKFIFKIYFFYFRNKVWDTKALKKWNELLVSMAREYREKAEKLGGVLVKVGQFLSTRADLMPAIVIKEFEGLVDQVPPMSFHYARAKMEQEWGTDIYEQLSEIESSPTDSASIGEVYKGKLKDGQEVAIKIQRYKIQEIFHKDFIALRIVFWILKVFTAFGRKADLNGLYTEIVSVMGRELDYYQEVEFGKYFKERYADFESIYIPSYYETLSTEKVLVMEWVNGEKITDIDFLRKNHIDVEETSKILFDLYIDQFLRPGKFHADPHAGNIMINENGLIFIIDFGMFGEVKPRDIEHFKLLVQGLIVGNYDIVVSALDKMNFILPEADKGKLKKVIEEAVELYQDGSVKNMDAQTLGQIQEDLTIIIKEQPVQLSADYTYLLRAVSIVAGILYTIHPEMDLIKWARPKITKWFGKREIAQSITKQYVKDAAEPVLSYPKGLLNFLERGERDRKWDKEKHFDLLKHQFYLRLESICFIMVLIGIGMSLFGLTMNQLATSIIGFSVIAIFAVAATIFIIKHYRFIRLRKTK